VLEARRAGAPREPTGSRVRAPGSAGAPGRRGTASRRGGDRSGPPLVGARPRRRPRRRETTTTTGAEREVGAEIGAASARRAGEAEVKVQIHPNAAQRGVIGGHPAAGRLPSRTHRSPKSSRLPASASHGTPRRARTALRAARGLAG
jgi:hypothetical protein